MKKAEMQIPVAEKSLFSWVFSGNMKLQVLLIIIILITVFARVLPLEMQKRIVNEAIRLKKIDLLLLYCGIYLVAVFASGGLKYLINILQTVIGQRATAAMRKELYHHILTLPLSFFRKTQPGMVVSSLVAELASAGDFVGMAIAVPVTNILTLIAFAGYLFWLNPLLAAVSLSIYPIVLFLLPMLQKRANTENKKRVDTTRKLSSLIAESITGIHEIQGNGAYHIENQKYDNLVNKLTKIRIIWNFYRFGIKGFNNFFNSLSPFLIFILGGYLAINGQLELGALVAFLSAQEKLYDPWKELIDFYQSYQDASISYYRTMEYFDLLPEYELEPSGRKPFDLAGSLEVQELSFEPESGIKLIDNVTFSLRPGEHLALVGFSGSGKSTLAQCIGQLYKYTGGHVWIGEKEVSNLSKRDIINNLGFVSQMPFIFSGTIKENLLYACSAKIKEDGSDKDDVMPTLDDMIEVLQQTGLFVDVLRFGLHAIIDRQKNKEMGNQLIRVRRKFHLKFGKELSEYVEFFNENNYMNYSSITENLTFGAFGQESFSDKNLFKNEYFQNFLSENELIDPLLNLGAKLTQRTVDILRNLPAEEMFFEQSPISSEELSEYKILADRLKKIDLHQLSSDEREKILKSALRFTPGKHKMVALSENLRQLILKGRKRFREKISMYFPGAFSFYQRSDYIYNQSILNNIFFGKTKTNNPRIQDKIYQSIIQLLIEEDIMEAIVNIGMQYNVGSQGDKLSGGQRQKLAIARVLLKKPKILIMDEATSGLDNKSQARIQSLIETRWKGKSTLIAVIHRLDIIKNYDKVAVMKAGKLAEIGTYDELVESKGMLYELITGKK
ncbi:MAG: ABC transporter ATP-binding protein/permease [Desulfobacterales bacterium]|nr:ABC transporter ATP-binding protein/permease [Desulfobacterales bacterium]